MVDFPANPEYQGELARSHQNLALLLGELQEYSETERHLKRAMGLLDELAAQHPELPEYRRLQERNVSALGQLAREKNRLQDAERYFRRAMELTQKLVGEFPTVIDYRSDLGGCSDDLSDVLLKTVRWQEADKMTGDSLVLWKNLAAKFPEVVPYQSGLANALKNRGRLSLQRGQAGEAQKLLQEAITHVRTALKENSQTVRYRENLRAQYKYLIQARMMQGDNPGALNAASELATSFPDNAEDTFSAGCSLARCMPLLGKDSGFSKEKSKQAVDLYGKRALELLRQALDRGFRDSAQLKKEPNLEPLRSNSDFQRLLAEVNESKRKQNQGHH